MAEEKNSVQEEKWDIVIKPKDKLFSVDFKELWAYRDLWSLFVKRNIITQYKQTILGPAWFVIQPSRSPMSRRMENTPFLAEGPG